MALLNVLLATTWESACGIAEHSYYLKETVEAADREILVTPHVAALDPQGEIPHPVGGYFDVLHLNYHRALHSRWTPEVLRRIKEARQYRAIVITFHDTFGELEPDSLPVELSELADAFIVHEPCEGLPRSIYWRMGVAGWPREPIYDFPPWNWDGRPVLGTVGFPFGWKNYEVLCDLTREAGWGLLLIAPGAAPEQIAVWKERQPYLDVRPDFVSRERVVSLLAACDASAFLYTCANSGQSGAVCQGIAARKPVLALWTCRQFRALRSDEVGRTAITWAETFEDVERLLRAVPIGRVSPAVVALAERDSWAKLGRNYAALYRRVAEMPA
jgi:hypothetical protein